MYIYLNLIFVAANFFMYINILYLSIYEYERSRKFNQMFYRTELLLEIDRLDISKAFLILHLWMIYSKASFPLNSKRCIL